MHRDLAVISNGSRIADLIKSVSLLRIPGARFRIIKIERALISDLTLFPWMLHALLELPDYAWRNLSRDEPLGDQIDPSSKIGTQKESLLTIGSRDASDTITCKRPRIVHRYVYSIRFSIIMCQCVVEFQPEWTESRYVYRHVLSCDLSMMICNYQSRSTARIRVHAYCILNGHARIHIQRIGDTQDSHSAHLPVLFLSFHARHAAYQARMRIKGEWNITVIPRT